MKKKRVYICEKEVVMENTDNAGKSAFTVGKEYTRTQPEVWPPIETGVIVCFIDDFGEEHFFDGDELHKHFTRIK